MNNVWATERALEQLKDEVSIELVAQRIRRDGIYEGYKGYVDDMYDTYILLKDEDESGMTSFEEVKENK